MSSQRTVLGEGAQVEHDPFAGAALARVVPTTEPQREVWLADRLGREAPLAFNESVSLRFSGPLDIEALRGAFQDLGLRHESLRATLSANGEGFCIASAIELEFKLTEHEGLTGEGREAALSAARHRAVETPFVLEQGPLFRAELVRLGVSDHVLILCAHHIVCDGWSFGVLIKDLSRLYRKRLGHDPEALEAPASFGDYALAQRAAAGGPESEAASAYWLTRFAGSLPVLDLPTDRPRAAWRTFTSLREDHDLDADLIAALRIVGSRSGASLFGTLLSGFAALLHRLSGSEDLVIGIPAAGQSVGGFDGLVGHCVNLLPLRIPLAHDTPIKAALAATQTAVLDAYEHQECTFGKLLKKLSVERDPSRLPLVSVMFNVDRELDGNNPGFPGLAVEVTSNPRSFENFELFINAVQTGKGVRLECQYNTDLFDAATIRRWLACFECILRATCASTDVAVGAIELVEGDERRLLDTWNDTARPFSRGALVHELIEARVSREPARAALRWNSERLSYAELDARANRIARCLRARGIRRGTLVGLHLSRSPQMLCALLGILKAGAAYVPLDPSYPADRLAFMMEDAGLSVLLTDSSLPLPAEWPRERTLLLDLDRAEIAAQPATSLARDASSADGEDCAYVIYTSGSTGKPKGVRVPHRAVVNYLESIRDEPGMTESDRLVAVTTLSFDIAVTELILPLCVGAEIVLAAREVAMDGEQLHRLVQDSQATIMQATPSTWRLLIGAGWTGGPGFKVLCGGEALSGDLANLLLERTGSLWNMYGPTETTVWSTCARITDTRAGITIGRPIANTTVWILDPRGQLCPVGVPGEIWIGGDGVTLGYLNRPDLTAERFQADRFSASSAGRLYRTGDRGRWKSDGSIEHLGRLDTQVKVRGFRIELGEIEVRLALHPEVKQAAVIAREDRPGDVRLVAYLVPRAGTSPSASVLKAHLKQSLPEYMIPQHFVLLSAIPLLPNGKTDRKALPAPDAPVRPEMDFVAPNGELECAIAVEMEVSLGMSGIGRHDDFFSLGGHSLLAAQLTNRLNRKLECGLSMRTLFEAPTVALLAKIIEGASGTDSASQLAPIPRLADQARVAASVMQERMWFLEQINPGRVVYHAPSAHRLQGALDEQAFQSAFDELVARQSSLRTCFRREGEQVIQHVQERVQAPLFPAEDLSDLPEAERNARLTQRLDELTAEPFDLSRAPLFKARMFRLAEQEHVLFFMAHHIVWDGWSFDLLYDEITALYSARCEGRPSPLADLPISYGDFAVWHRQWMKSAEVAKQLAFWRERLQRIGLPKPLPTDKPRRPGMSGAGSTEWIKVDKQRTDALHEISGQYGATLFMTTLSLYGVLLYDYARQTRLVIGTPVRGRERPDLEQVMGYFNNLLPLQLEVDPSERFSDFVLRVKKTVIETFANPDVSLESLPRELSVAQGVAGTVLYQALFSFQDARQRVTRWGNLGHSMVPLFQRGATEDFGLWFIETANGLQGGMTYNTDVLTDDTARVLHQRLQRILEMVSVNPHATVAELAGAAHWQHLERREAGGSNGASHGPDELNGAHPGTTSSANGRQRSYVAPRNDLEVGLATVWQRVLGVERVGITDNFFELGGNSLSAISLILQMEAAGGIKIDLGHVFQHPTIESLVTTLGADAKHAASVVVTLQAEGDGIPIFCLVGLNLYREFAESLGKGQPVFGVYVSEEQALVTQSMRGRQPDVSVDRLTEAYDRAIARFRPKGPYRLAGLSFGGVLAMELASRMRARGEQVDLVILLDTMLAEGMHRDRTKLLMRPVTALVDGSAIRVARRLAFKLKERFEGVSKRDAPVPVGSQRTVPIARGNAIKRAALFQATKRWNIERIVTDFRVVLFHGTDHSDWAAHVKFDDDYGWGRHIRGQFQVEHVDGNHLTLVESPHVAELGRRVQRLLAQSPPA